MESNEAQIEQVVDEIRMESNEAQIERVVDEIREAFGAGPTLAAQVKDILTREFSEPQIPEQPPEEQLPDAGG